MSKSKKEELILRIARESLGCMTAIAKLATEALRPRSSKGASAPISRNPLNDSRADDNRQRISSEVQMSFEVLKDDPLSARVDYTDTENQKHTIFVAQRPPGPVSDFTVASYGSGWGELAEASAGDEVCVKIKDIEHWFTVDSVTMINPVNEKQRWDSRDSKVDILNSKPSIVTSLYKILGFAEQVQDDDSVDPWRAAIEADPPRRKFLERLALRRQSILTRMQGRILRLPINSQCFLSGPPGTGKTTTFIKRLGQKSDPLVLNDTNDDIRLVKQVEEETGELHNDNWIMFLPKELLRQFVNEAFARERLPAGEERIKTWGKFRNKIALSNLRLLKTGTSGSFDFHEQEDHLDSGTMKQTEWYDDFRTYLDHSNLKDIKGLRSDAEWLAKRESEDLRNVGIRLGDALSGEFKKNLYSNTTRVIEPFATDIRVAIKSRTEDIKRILNRAGNVLTKADPNFPEQLHDEVKRQLATVSNETPDNDDAETEQDDEDDEISTPRSGQPISMRYVGERLDSALKALASTKVTGRPISKRSRHNKLLTWLGKERIPADEDMITLGNLLAERRRLRRFEGLGQKFVQNIAVKYRRFRTEMTKKKCWYTNKTVKSSDIHWRELDLVVLAVLQVANEILESYRRSATAELPREGLLFSILRLQKAQVFVDEATDFSAIQLACMYEISHPALRSFFMCGDINQRLSPWGIKSYETLKWISPRIKHAIIDVSYRQTRPLVDLAEEIALLEESNPTKIRSPDELKGEDVKPVWQTHLKRPDQVAEWMKHRIHEMQQILNTDKTSDHVFPTIAVLVNEEKFVKPLASELGKHLKEFNRSVTACIDGEIKGDDEEIRVFHIEHIKGLEFEAVFFVDLDKTVTNHPTLFKYYLYVGATRARSFLGITFHDEIPDRLDPIKKHFEGDWSKFV